jgi:D-tyrosyl-tRNA(Tyr) deacylase
MVISTLAKELLAVRLGHLPKRFPTVFESRNHVPHHGTVGYPDVTITVDDLSNYWVHDESSCG